MQMPRIAYIGDLTADKYMDSHTTKFGGAALNMAIWTKRVHAQARIFSAIGTDTIGRSFLPFLKKHGLNSQTIQKKRGKTSSIEIFLKNGERVYGAWDPGVLATYHLKTSDILSLVKSDAIVMTVYPAYVHLLDELKKLKNSTVKPPQIVINFGDMKEFGDSLEVVEHAMECADILVFGLDKDSDEHLINSIRLLAGAHNTMVMVTLGASGVIVWEKGKTFVQSAKPVTVIDSTGAGDAFLAGFFAKYLQTRMVQNSLKNGVRLASKVLGRIGAY